MVNDSVLAQPQQAWVARYNGGFTNKTHTPLAMKLDNAGNIYNAGSSQNVSNFYDYVVLKYAPNGTQFYAARYSSTNGINYTVSGFALDQNGNTYVTGTGGTVKVGTDGVVAWIAPYAGNDVVVDTNGNVYVAGFSTTEYATVKLDSTGSNLWVRTYANGQADGVWPTASQKVAVDNAGQVYVAGWEAWGPSYRCNAGQTNQCRYSTAGMLMYDSAGNCIWTNENLTPFRNWGQIKGLILDNQGNIYVTGDVDSYYLAKINASGQKMWNFEKGPSVSAMTIDSNGNSYLDGLRLEGGGATSYGTFKLDPNGQELWEEDYNPVSGQHQATSINLDNIGYVYVTGVSTNSGTGNDFATIKYDANGNQQWVIRYNGPANGNDGATAIAVAPDGSITSPAIPPTPTAALTSPPSNTAIWPTFKKSVTAASNSNSSAIPVRATNSRPPRIF